MAAAIGYVRGMFQWTVKREGSSLRTSRPPAVQSVARGRPNNHICHVRGDGAGAGHHGLNPNTAIFFSGIGTLIFFVFVRGPRPELPGIELLVHRRVMSAEAIGGGHNIPVALGGIIACGAVYALIGLIVMAVRLQMVEFLMPPIVTGAVVAVVGPESCFVRGRIHDLGPRGN